MASSLPSSGSFRKNVGLLLGKAQADGEENTKGLKRIMEINIFWTYISKCRDWKAWCTDSMYKLSWGWVTNLRTPPSQPRSARPSTTPLLQHTQSTPSQHIPPSHSEGERYNDPDKLERRINTLPHVP